MRSNPHYFLTKLPFKFALILLWTDTVNTLLLFTNFTVFWSLSYFLLDAVHLQLWYIFYNVFLIFDCFEQYGQVSEFYFLKSFVLSDFSFVSGLYFKGKPNLPNLSKSRKNVRRLWNFTQFKCFVMKAQYSWKTSTVT